MPLRKAAAFDRLYVQLVSTLYDTLVPTTIMSIGFVLSFSLFIIEAEDPALAWIAGLGALSGVWRVLVVLVGRSEKAAKQLDVYRARILERRFSIAYYQFSILLGVSTSYALMTAVPNSKALIVCLIVGYGAGAAVGVGLRPKIAIPSMVTAIVPAIIAIATRGNPVDWLTAAMMLALLIGGITSLLARYRLASMQITERLTFEMLARQDSLTSLPNRLALREWYDRFVAVSGDERIFAVHCLDLDKFKPVNDVFGHPVGDDLLRAVAGRLTRTLRPSDIVARLGGDEFAVIQPNLLNGQEAVALACRLREAIADPFSIRGHTIRISTCIGISFSGQVTSELEELLELADQALYRAKKSGTGVECCYPSGNAMRLAS